MNIHIVSGTVAFVLWSAFSTWYYINYIKVFDNESQSVQVAQVEEPREKPSPKPAEQAAPIPEAPKVEQAATIEEEPAVPVALNISRDFYFAKNSTRLLTEGTFKSFLDSLIVLYESVDVTFEGHTCDLGTDEHNLKLSKARAAVLASKAFALGLSRSNVQQDFFGETRPKVSNTSEANRKRNRRVTVLIQTTP